MIDRTLLTEALAEYDRGEGRMLDGWATEILVIVEVARWARDFPTDEQVEAAAQAIYDAHQAGAGGLDAARRALEAVRQTMIGDIDDV
jgi:hypothetical protein